MALRYAGEIRLIGGQWKRSKLAVADRAGLRPTPDRVRETLFNWLGQNLDGWRCLDAFAGTGALGLEAASRGAQLVDLVEQDPMLVRALRSSVEKLKGEARVRVLQGDGLQALSRAAAAPVHLVFLDPPYSSGLLARAWPLVARAVVPGGWVYTEGSATTAEPAVAPAEGIELYRSLRAGQVLAQLWRRLPVAS
jgi:16S rRNA (guanine(966)-N(2))-methyltransferase RsmD